MYGSGLVHWVGGLSWYTGVGRLARPSVRIFNVPRYTSVPYKHTWRYGEEGDGVGAAAGSDSEAGSRIESQLYCRDYAAFRRKFAEENNAKINSAKQLAGGGMMKIVNRTVPQSLQTLGYKQPAINRIQEYIEKQETIEGAEDLRPEHLPIFDCAFQPANGERSINWRAHIGMMAAAQPFLSGAISKTVNMPADSSVADIENAYLEGWRQGLKALAIYRDGSKQSQPLATSKEGDRQHDGSDSDSDVRQPVRRRLPATRQSITHKFSVGGHEGYVTVGVFEDGSPGELFITMAK